MLNVILEGAEITLNAGESTALPAGKVYRDAPDGLLTEIQNDLTKGTPWREAATNHLAGINPWLLRVVTDPARTRWLELNPPRPGSWVLDVGAGWGQWAVPAAATAHVVALEPTPARLAITRAIAEQDGRKDRMFFVGAALESVAFPNLRFDHIYCIGVLEWVPSYSPRTDPIDAQRAFLRRLRSMLAPDGECIIGIENRVGLKYLLGARDDHTGLANISVLDAATAAQRYLAKTGKPLRVFTHSLAEYQTILSETGFTGVEFFAAYPDYKVPQAILSIADGAANQHCLKGSFISEHDGADGTPLAFQEELASHYRSLGELGIAGQFAPSFFIRVRR